MPSKLAYRAARKGEVFVATGPAGGGYGDPFERDPQAVLDDVMDGLVSETSARELYGVAAAGGALDLAATAALRAKGAK